MFRLLYLLGLFATIVTPFTVTSDPSYINLMSRPVNLLTGGNYVYVSDKPNVFVDTIQYYNLTPGVVYDFKVEFINTSGVPVQTSNKAVTSSELPTELKTWLTEHPKAVTLKPFTDNDPLVRWGGTFSYKAESHNGGIPVYYVIPEPMTLLAQNFYIRVSTSGFTYNSSDHGYYLHNPTIDVKMPSAVEVGEPFTVKVSSPFFKGDKDHSYTVGVVFYKNSCTPNNRIHTINKSNVDFSKDITFDNVTLNQSGSVVWETRLIKDNKTYNIGPCGASKVSILPYKVPPTASGKPVVINDLPAAGLAEQSHIIFVGSTFVLLGVVFSVLSLRALIKISNITKGL